MALLLADRGIKVLEFALPLFGLRAIPDVQGPVFKRLMTLDIRPANFCGFSSTSR